MTIVIISPARFYFSLNMELNKPESSALPSTKFITKGGPGRFFLQRIDTTTGLLTTTAISQTTSSAESSFSTRSTPPPG